MRKDIPTVQGLQSRAGKSAALMWVKSQDYMFVDN